MYLSKSHFPLIIRTNAFGLNQFSFYLIFNSSKIKIEKKIHRMTASNFQTVLQLKKKFSFQTITVVI